jgi:hypothetical protein
MRPMYADICSFTLRPVPMPWKFRSALRFSARACRKGTSRNVNTHG